jgi:O-methyltransferase
VDEVFGPHSIPLSNERSNCIAIYVRSVMAGQTPLSRELLAYHRDVSLREDDILRDLREETDKYPMGQVMRVMPEEGQLLGLLVALTSASSVLEIGTFTGYSTLCMARSLPPGGRLVTCDITDKWPQIGVPYWEAAGVADLIEVRIGDARETLADLLEKSGPESIDFTFVDADKVSYPVYYESALSLLRPGGLMVLDNTLFFGRVIDSTAQDLDTVAVRKLNTLLRDDERVDQCMLSMADGITLVRKRQRLAQ